MATQLLTLNFAKPMRLFPLPGCVLLPYTSVPLHIFEPSYRAMLRDALDSDGLIAMATFDPHALEVTEESLLQIRPCVCVSYVMRHDRLPDGRYNILVQGLCRARITEEQPLHEDGYRVARLEPFGILPDAEEVDQLTSVRDRLDALLEDEFLRKLAAVSAVRNLVNPEVATNVLIDLGLMALSQDGAQRYEALAESDPLLRGLMLEHHLLSMRDVVKRAEHFAAARDEEGWSLN